MKLNVRITAMFLLQLVILFIIVCAIGITFGIYIAKVQAPEQRFQPNPSLILEQLSKSTSIQGNHIKVSEKILTTIRQSGGWVQILNGNGKEIYNEGRPKNVPTKYSPGQLVSDKTYPNKFGYQLFTWYDQVDGQSLTWIYGLPLSVHTRWESIHPYLYLSLIFIGSLLATIIIAFLFGRQLGGPILYMINWIQKLAGGNYSEPTYKRRGFFRKNKPKTFKLYREVLDSLSQLAVVLQRNEVEHSRLERTREDWITGISHDLKTPLSSVKGYADLLESQDYEWSESETRHFGHVISEKAAYMEGLIEDLSLTYRLRNNAIPLQSKPENVVEILRRVVIDLVNHPQSEGQDVHFKSNLQHAIYPIDEKWFKRAFDNLLANASLHNPVGTTIFLEVTSTANDNFRYNEISILIKDNGVGMDEDTVHHLFDRYYRGTNTADHEARGTGLGSAIAKQLIEAHSGTISVDSHLGQGTTISVHLPAKN